MSTPSSWPLPQESIRFVVPRRTVSEMREHPLCKELYPLGIGYYKQAIGHKMERKEHDDNLLIYCLEGVGNLRCNATEHKVNAGDLIILPKGVLHSYSASHDNPWTIYWIHFNGDLAKQFIQLINANLESPILNLGIQSRLVTSFETLLEVRQARIHQPAAIFAANLLREILSHIALLRPLVNQQKQEQSLDLEKVHSLMAARVQEQLDLDTLAASCNLSKYHFIKRYKAATGSTPINHFIHLKIERACHLLDVTEQNINEVAFAVGYEDAYYFSRIFRKIMGMSPSQYRKMRLGSFPYHSS